jgi:hypothetical protein
MFGSKVHLLERVVATADNYVQRDTLYFVMSLCSKSENLQVALR